MQNASLINPAILIRQWLVKNTHRHTQTKTRGNSYMLIYNDVDDADINRPYTERLWLAR